MSVGSRRPTVSKQLRNYADNTPLSPGGKKILTAISIAKSKLVSKIFDPIFGRRKKKKRREISSSDSPLLDHRNFKKCSTRWGKGGDASFFGRRSVIFLAPTIRRNSFEAPFGESLSPTSNAFRDTPHRRKETLDKPLASLPDPLSCRASPLLDANWQDRKQLDRLLKIGSSFLFFSFYFFFLLKLLKRMKTRFFFSKQEEREDHKDRIPTGQRVVLKVDDNEDDRSPQYVIVSKRGE